MGGLLDVEELKIIYESTNRRVTALDSVNLVINKNELLAVVGESGCGKTTLGLAIIGLLPARNSVLEKGSIRYKDVDLVKLDSERLRFYRGTEIGMIFQEPLTSLDPVYKVGNQIAEAIAIRRLRKVEDIDTRSKAVQKTYHAISPSPMSRMRREIPSELRGEVVDWLKLVRIGDPEQVIDRYPFELSGGMMQRIMIAMALSEEPELLIADEPTTALDVTTQAQVLKLMKELMDKVRTSILLVTHDLAVASQVADRVVVMYAGEIVESSDVDDLFAEPLHPYTKGLLYCIPSGSKDDFDLKPISGSVPDLTKVYAGCKFANRCPHAMKVCMEKRPGLLAAKKNHLVACFLYGE